jgi:hypothetical protein
MKQFKVFLSAVIFFTACLVLASSMFSQGQGTDSQESKNAFEVLNGKWLRPDGVYTLHIKSVAPNGVIDVSFYNHVQINVSRAIATMEGKTIKVFIELRDAGYPSCSYNLSYDDERDELKGEYYQASTQESIEINFIRVTS